MFAPLKLISLFAVEYLTSFSNQKYAVRLYKSYIKCNYEQILNVSSYKNDHGAIFEVYMTNLMRQLCISVKIRSSIESIAFVIIVFRFQIRTVLLVFSGITMNIFLFVSCYRHHESLLCKNIKINPQVTKVIYIWSTHS